jgi:hypothetical protein
VLSNNGTPPLAFTRPGCPHTLTQPGSSLTAIKTSSVAVVAPAAQSVCAAASSASFTFDVSAPGATTVLVNDTGLCSVAQDRMSITCAAVPVPGAAVSVTATYGDKACSTTPVVVELPVSVEAAISVTDVTPTSSQICPSAATGTVSFQVTTSAPAKALSGSLVASPGGEPVGAGVSCIAAGNGTAWSVACEGAPAGTYAVALTVESELSECVAWHGVAWRGVAWRGGEGGGEGGAGPMDRRGR